MSLRQTYFGVLQMRYNLTKFIYMTIIKWAISAIVCLIPPVLLWNVWFLDYIDQHGKLWAWISTPVWPFAAAAIFLGLSTAKERAAQNGFINPFWGWFGGGLVINIFITALSNS